ncbi:hypothetical protein GCM10010168_32120 [Actinoplanes ianthinogenes]|uniref:Uncharacterized protein n=1 Tax=Actinoplanes ianthinogenes TaxID=122358 RepID=A0ABM7LMC5_9ACTN|nr:hypothetical protein [Actinoplanes ianthinogenes]BCJ40353.1 hypothetical protein Aiant_10100 [Actinoplanes ianthinogenes]GGR11648.1 hypothetical protein GCM10010168_32120 [Actinoplanes ianthinogenes]
MTSSHPGQPADPHGPRPQGEAPKGRADRRRERIRRDVQAARTGRQLVPTWLMALLLALFLGGWIYLIITK